MQKLQSSTSPQPADSLEAIWSNAATIWHQIYVGLSTKSYKSVVSNRVYVTFHSGGIRGTRDLRDNGHIHLKRQELVSHLVPFSNPKHAFLRLGLLFRQNGVQNVSLYVFHCLKPSIVQSLSDKLMLNLLSCPSCSQFILECVKCVFASKRLCISCFP